MSQSPIHWVLVSLKKMIGRKGNGKEVAIPYSLGLSFSQKCRCRICGNDIEESQSPIHWVLVSLEWR